MTASTSPRQTLGAFVVLWAFFGLPVIAVFTIAIAFLVFVARLALLPIAAVVAIANFVVKNLCGSE
jgi:hypothetical protein